MTIRAFVFAVPSPFATTMAARVAAVRRLAAIASALGLPRNVQESDITRVGPVSQTIPLAFFPRRRWWARPRLISAGPLSGSIIFFLDVDHPAIAALHGQTLAWPATYDGISLGSAGSFVCDLTAGVAVTANHEGSEEDPT